MANLFTFPVTWTYFLGSFVVEALVFIFAATFVSIFAATFVATFVATFAFKLEEFFLSTIVTSTLFFIFKFTSPDGFLNKHNRRTPADNKIAERMTRKSAISNV